jgi:peptide/nickel transport system permease protein
MLIYIVQRIIYIIPILLIISVVSFLIIHLAPGDPITALLGPGTVLSDEQHQILREKYHFNKSLPVQYFYWLTDILKGDLGWSFSNNKSVKELIIERFPATFLLTFTSFLISLIISLPLGVLAAAKKNTWVDYSAISFALIGLSIPNFVMALLIILIFGLYLNILPTMGYVELSSNFFLSIKHLIGPAFSLGLIVSAILVRYIRAEILDELQKDYVSVARAKGISEYKVMFKHVFRNAAITILTIWSLYFARYLGGTIIIEQIFSWPGIGRLAFKAVSGRDYPLLQGLILTFGLIFILTNLLTDLVYLAIDPRITYRKIK